MPLLLFPTQVSPQGKCYKFINECFLRAVLVQHVCARSRLLPKSLLSLSVPGNAASLGLHLWEHLSRAVSQACLFSHCSSAHSSVCTPPPGPWQQRALTRGRAAQWGAEGGGGGLLKTL